MIYKYTEMINKGIYNSNIKIKKVINNVMKNYLKLVFLYSNRKINRKINSKLEIILKSIKTIFLILIAPFFYHGLTDNIPLKYYLASKRGAQKIKSDDIFQTFMDNKYFEIGDLFIYYNNVKIRIYDKEKIKL